MMDRAMAIAPGKKRAKTKPAKSKKKPMVKGQGRMNDYNESPLVSAGLMSKRDFSQAQREQAAQRGHALRGGGYPIETVVDLKNAIQAIGRAKNPDATKRLIKRRARALNATNLLPDSW